MKSALVTGLSFLLVLAVGNTFGTAYGQSGNLVTGVVVAVHTGDDGALSGVALVTSEGETVQFAVNSATSFGLENAVGDRWVSDSGDTNLGEAETKLRDQQRRQQQVTAQLNADGSASSVVQARPVSVSSNLGYLFAAFAIGWLALMSYVLYLGQRHRSLQHEIRQMQGSEHED